MIKKILFFSWSFKINFVPLQKERKDINMEEWKTLWWNTRYEVSNMGRVRNKRNGKILATNPTKTHRKPQVWLYTDYFGTTCQYTLARLIYFTFNGVAAESTLKRVYHRDGDIMNCKLENLYIK